MANTNNTDRAQWKFNAQYADTEVRRVSDDKLLAVVHGGPEQARIVSLLKAAPQPNAAADGWISVGERLPAWASRDATPCFINGREVPPTLFSETVLVSLNGGGVRTDKLTTIEGGSDGWWHTYGERVIAWQPCPAPPTLYTKKEQP